MKDEFKRTEQTATDLRSRGWKDPWEGPQGEERRAMRRAARRKMHQETEAAARGERKDR